MNGTLSIVNLTHSQIKSSVKYDAFFRLFHEESIRLDIGSPNKIGKMLVQFELVGLPADRLVVTPSIEGGAILSSNLSAGVTVVFYETSFTGSFPELTLTLSLSNE